MSTLPIVRVGGVPEHFNLPWHLARERGLDQKYGVKIEWVEQKEGTGQMIKSAKEDQVDLIVALTEGLVSEIAKGYSNPETKDSDKQLRLISTYVESPLCWAISTGSQSQYMDVESLKGTKWGISRFTSGSHLMAIVLAHQRGWNLDMQFDVQGSFEKLRNGVNSGATSAFMWETFTTKPFHDSGEIRRIGEITTPWSCFMIAATRHTLENKAKHIHSALQAIREACAIFHAENTNMPSLVAERFKLLPEDALAWYSQVKISATPVILQSGLSRVLNTLKEANVIDQTNTCQPKDIIDPNFAELETVDLKSMKLYSRPELITRTYNELAARGWSRGDLDWKQLAQIDQQHHYHGTEAVDSAIQHANIDAKSKVISLGSGLGGPARYIAGQTGASVLSIEVQHDLSQVAEELTIRTHLDHLVHHMAANFLQAHSHLRLASYNAIVSWLTVLHIADREKLFKSSYELLVPGGVFYAEDFYRRADFTEKEAKMLKEDVFCAELPTAETYKQTIKDAGLELVQFEDLTEDWTQYSADRVTNMEANKEAFIKLHGPDIYERLHYFYTVIRDLFAGGSLCGVKVVARRPNQS